MASISENKQSWSDPGHWKRYNLGEDWSKDFGNTDIMWYSYIYPRINKFIRDNKKVLEIAPGTGRITRYLISHDINYVGYDVSEYCINHCNKNYNEKFYLNDGKSFHNTEDNSIDFIFSWDSLVHAEKDAMFAYAEESLRCLKDDGVAFIHHSNINKVNYGQNPHWRGNFSAEELKDHIEKNGGSVILQEFITWDNDNLDYCDAITVFSRKRNSEFIGINNALFTVVRDQNKRILSVYDSI